ncbi:MAG TPA: hypothetical protein ENI80_07170 [Acidiferrobacteraceae bacterium]|nr:hypothetical protein [Acidiferrobacteraceae bacterium]
MNIKNRTVFFIVALIAVIGFFVWRFIRPMNIYVVSEAFERPIDTSIIPAPLRTLRATECAACHSDFYDEWRTTIHSQAWTDPYFQADWKFEDKQQTCKNCHIPLDRQQEYKVLGFRDEEKWDPILAPNPAFDPKLQHEGVTCAVCHLREGKIIGVYGNTQAPHPVKKIDDPNQICVRCHVVEGNRWDTFFRFPPCGTVAEIKATRNTRASKQGTGLLSDTPGNNAGTAAIEKPQSGAPSMNKAPTGASGEITVPDTKRLGCVQCHMPLIKRPLVAGGKPRLARRHLWRGGHDPEMVKRGLEVNFKAAPDDSSDKRSFILTITNVGAAHYLPTGTPDRHLTVTLRLLGKGGNILKEETHTLKRTIMWRPFIVDLWDTRLPRWQPRNYRLDISDVQNTAAVEAVVRYYLVAEERLKRIGYKSEEPLAYDVFQKRITLKAN